MFDFCINFNYDDIPIGIGSMIHDMKKHLLQYGDIMYLDTQKHQYNNKEIGRETISNCSS